MKILNATRGYGKTTMLIYTSFVTGYPIIVANEMKKKYINNLANRMGLNINVYTALKFKAEHNGLETPHVLIDDAEEIIEEALMDYFNAKIEGVTISIPVINTNLREIKKF